ncbi:hypothetical protein BLNAU_16326 [Blattamonas nauphoetae]|uniref:Uncharacterized protein n=1 Tax=Blattamonas nauphoetae TaxID=2049346 RepID=A0ABQ9X8G5_9EUKA|nr:hypothetical protein BLNAU_16326 [Blattamonas nauphoetae]
MKPFSDLAETPIQLLPSAMHLFVGSDDPRNRCSAHSLLSHVASFADGSSTDSIPSIGVLISSAQPDRHNTTTLFMKHITQHCPERLQLKLAETDTRDFHIHLEHRPELSLARICTCSQTPRHPTLLCMRMEELEDTVEGRLVTDRKGDWGGGVVSKWMVLRNLVGLTVGQFQRGRHALLIASAVTSATSRLLEHPTSLIRCTARLWKAMRRWMVIIGGDSKRNAKRGKCATVLLHISPPFFTAADEAWRRFSSLSSMTPQLVAGPHSTRGNDEIAVDCLEWKEYKRTHDVQQGRKTEHRHSRPGDLAHRIRSGSVSDQTHVTSSPSLTSCVGTVWSLQGQLATLQSLSNEQQTKNKHWEQTMGGLSRVKRREVLTKSKEMTEIDKKTDPSSSQAHSDLPSPQLPFSMDCSQFLNWDEEKLESEQEKAVVFRSLVATLKSQHALDALLEAKAVKFLESVDPPTQYSAAAFLRRLASSSDDYSTNFVQSIEALLSSASQVITTATMQMIKSLIVCGHSKVQLSLVQANLIPQLIVTLNPLSLSFAKTVNIHKCLMIIIALYFWYATPHNLIQLGIEDDNEQQAVHETVWKQFITPSEKYIWHLCVNRFSIVDRSQSESFLTLLTKILEISPYHQQTMDFVLNMPVILTIPSCLTFFGRDFSIWNFLNDLNTVLRDWNREGGEVQLMGKTILRMLRMEGFEDVMEEKLQNNRNKVRGRLIVRRSIEWNNLQGMNLPKQS